VNHAFAKMYFPEVATIGQRINLGFGGEREIVGIFADAKQSDFRQATPPTVFLPFAHGAAIGGTAHYTVRTTGEPGAMMGAIRGAVAEIERHMPLADVRTQDERVDSLLSSERLFGRLTVFFGLVALALAGVGLYGLMAYGVQRRTGEIGLRMALGARPANILRMLLRESAALVLLGIALGVGGAGVATRLVAHLLYGLSPTDVATYAGVGLLMLVVGTIATLLPARRAAKIDPMVALRND
jgi:predicted lysophospholipase L1 biosynthesis ABC-type transport system permease subunit